MKKIVGILMAELVVLLCSCEKVNYLSVIPKNSKALISLDLSGMQMPDSIEKEFSGCGIDIMSDVFLFETNDGMFGLTANVDDEEKVKSWLTEKANSGQCQPVSERNHLNFTVYKNSWVMAFNEHSFLVLGPVVASQQAQVKYRISSMFKQEERKSIIGSPMLTQLEKVDAPLKLISQVDAMPELLVAPLTLGAPKDADASQVMLVAKMEIQDGMLQINGRTFSFNKRIDAALQESQKHFVVPKDSALNLTTECPFLFHVNYDKGESLLAMFRQNKSLQHLLSGANMVIDLDKIISNSEKYLTVGYGKQLQLITFLRDHSFLAKDVEYWKESCPQGSTISDHGHGEWMFHSSESNYLFGTHSNYFYIGSRKMAEKSEADAISRPVQQFLSRQRLFFLFNMKAETSNDISDLVKSYIPDFLSNLDYVVFSFDDSVVAE